MNAYSEDLRKKIVEAVERGMPTIQAAKTFGVGISSVKRYASKVERGESLAPNKSPGSGAVNDPARRRGSPSGSAGRKRRRLLLTVQLRRRPLKLDDPRLRAALAPLETLRAACRSSLPLGHDVLTFGAGAENML
jgi:hypothetical protein